MRLTLYVTCLVDLMRPFIGFASLRRLADGSRRTRTRTRTFGMASWRTAERDLPAPPGKTFHELYAARKRA